MRSSILRIGLGLLTLLLPAVGFAAERTAELTFDERVEAQRRIEDVYWRHRIWPKENPEPKPAFESVVTSEFLRHRVENYLRLSDALARVWEQAVTPEQLQAELSRMAASSKSPEVLRELFSALGDDPKLIAETLVRPSLVEKLARERYATDARIHADLRRRVEAARDACTSRDDACLAAQGADISVARWIRQSPEESQAERAEGSRRMEAVGSIPVDDVEWDAVIERFGLSNPTTSADRQLFEESDRFLVTRIMSRDPKRLTVDIATWQKPGLSQWLEEQGDALEARVPDAKGDYVLPPVTAESTFAGGESWTPPAWMPESRPYQTAVWTGSVMIIWGGLEYTNVGAKYDPATNTWTRTSTGLNVPERRAYHTAVWTGAHMIVWGGYSGTSPLNTGGRYDPTLDQWSPTSTTGAAGIRYSHTAVWSGTEMIVWGGTNGVSVNTGGRYNPQSNTWTSTSTGANVPGARMDHSAVWTGSQMIVWGGSVLNSGGRYDPVTNTWLPTSVGVNVPAARSRHKAVWTGTQMIVWGGWNGGASYFNTGGRYDPAADTWTATSTGANVPSARRSLAAIWTGTSMVVWGGFNGASSLGNGGRYDPVSNAWSTVTSVGAASARAELCAVWTGTEMIISGGYAENPPSNGAAYNPLTNSWRATSPQSFYAPLRSGYSTVWTGAEMIVWSGFGSTNFGSGWQNDGARYDPALDSWTATSTGAGVPAGRQDHTAVWTGTEMIVWGGQTSGGMLNNGGRYNPTLNSWTATSVSAGTPSNRFLHTAVWTGTEMIVWGGSDGSLYFNTGGRYSPASDTWAATSTAGAAPSARREHSAVWTGDKMVVWGGNNTGGLLNGGGRYDPPTDSWTTVSLGSAPAGRRSHSAVWTGSKMIVWGGIGAGSLPLNSGGTYSPLSDTWVAVPLSNAPSARSGHTAVWDGQQLLVWGGVFGSTFLNTGGRYRLDNDQWVAMALLPGTPSGRAYHGSVWTGSRLIVWGGRVGLANFEDGGVYTSGITTPPTVDEVTPAPDSVGVPEASNVTVRFSEPIIPATVSNVTVRLLANGVPVPSTVTVSTSATRVTLDPVATLSLDTLYTVDVVSAVTDVTGTAAVPFTSAFRTSATASSSRSLPSVSDQAAGIAAESRTGASVAPAGDINSDGVRDWIAGAPSYQAPNAALNSALTAGPVEAGAALVYLGSTSAAERSAPDIIFTGVSAHDRAGVSVASNFDFNGDGIKDIVIGAEQVNRTVDNDPGAGCDAGAPCGKGKVYLIYFNPSDAVHYPNIGNPAVADTVSLSLVGQPGGIPGVVFDGAAFGDQAGFSVAIGGTSTFSSGRDILIGAPGADPGGRTDAGAAYVVFDSPTLSGNVSLTRISSGLGDQIPGKAYLGAAAGDNLGFSTAFGGDLIQGQTAGTGTVLMSAPRASSDRGKVIAPPGDPDTTPIIVDAVGPTRPGFQIVGTQDGEKLGSSIAAGGDSIADGVPDLLFGAPTYDVGGQSDAGRVLQTTQIIASGVYNADAVGTTLGGVIWTGVATGDQLGTAVAGVADVTHDGIDDIVLGAPFVDPIIGGVPQADAGAVYLVHGTPVSGALGTRSVADVGTVYAGERLTGTQPGEHAGSSVAGTGDIDGNGDGDFVVGAPDKDVAADPDAGTIYLVTNTELPLVGGCGPAGCTVWDLSTGAEITVPPGGLATNVNIDVTGILSSGSLPGPVPSGKLFLGAADFDPEGQTFSSPFATLHLPTQAGLEVQLSPLESLPISYWTGSTWSPAGFNGSVVDNLQYPLRKALSASASVAHVYAVFLTDTDSDGLRDERDNCPAASNAAQTDGDGDGIGNVCDNCPLLANPSQSDSDNDSVGDACDTDARLTVSTNLSDVHDFTTIQAAVNAAVQSGTRIRIFPGTGPYLESVVVNRNFAFVFEGADDIAHTPVVVDGGGGIAFDVVTTAGGSRVTFDNLTIRGSGGIRSAVSTAMEDLVFEQVTALAVDLNGGSHTLDRIRMGSTVASGIDTASGVSLTLRSSRFEFLSGTTLRLGGPSTVETAVVGGGVGDGVVVLSTGSLALRHSTIAGNGGIGVDNTAGGAVTIAHAIVQDSAGGDLANVACASITWSNVKSQDCTATGSDLQTTCALAEDFRQTASSACLDYGPSPATFTGTPCLDLDNGPRLRDHDGDGIATIDPGAFERENTALTPGGVPNLRFTSKTTVQWDAEPSGLATEYHVYREVRTNLSYGNFGVCRDDLDADRTDLVLTDASTPTPGLCFVYVITGAQPGAPTQPDREGTMGLARCMERSNFSACP